MKISGMQPQFGRKPTKVELETLKNTVKEHFPTSSADTLDRSLVDVQDIKSNKGLNRLTKPFRGLKSAAGGLRLAKELFQKMLNKDTEKAEAFLLFKTSDKKAADALFEKVGKSEKPGSFEPVRVNDTEVLARITASKK